MLKGLALKIRRRETPFYDRLYHAAKRLRSLNMPVISPLHSFLYSERQMRLSIWHSIRQFLYYEPLFKTRCRQTGRGLRILGGIPQILGDLRLIIGDNVILHGASTFVGAKVYDKPTLFIGHNTHLGYQVGIVVGSDVKIGNNVLVGNRVEIYSYDMHPLDPVERLNNEPASAQSGRPVNIEDNVWICSNCIILKGVTVGKGSVVANGSVVTRDVPPGVVVGGNPAQIIKTI